jgi:hypothetical protein
MNYTKSVRDFLGSPEAREPIAELYVCRAPIAWLPGYYHVSMVVCLDTPVCLTVEKNLYIEVHAAPPSGVTDRLQVPLPDGVTITDLLEGGRAIQGDSAFFKYDPFSDNCQGFVASCLNAQGLLTPGLRSYVLQEVDAPDHLKTLVRKGFDLVRYMTGGSNHRSLQLIHHGPRRMV